MVVSGGAGFLGSHVCDALLADGDRVTCLDSEVTGSPRNLAAAMDDPGFVYLRCDVSEALPELEAVDLVVHMASVASPIAYARHGMATLRSGSLGTLNLLELAAQHSARFVFTSTSEVYGDPLEHPQRETYWGNVNPIGPRAVYDESKRFGEAAVIGAAGEWGVDAGIVRIFNTYGPRMAIDDGRVVPAFIDQALHGRPLTVAGRGTQTRSLCFVDDTVAAIVAMAGCSERGPVNVGNPQEMTIMDLATTILDLTGSASGIELMPLPQDDPHTRCPDITRAGDLLGWQPAVPLAEGLKQTIEWFSAT